MRQATEAAPVASVHSPQRSTALGRTTHSLRDRSGAGIFLDDGFFLALRLFGRLSMNFSSANGTSLPVVSLRLLAGIMGPLTRRFGVQQPVLRLFLSGSKRRGPRTQASPLYPRSWRTTSLSLLVSSSASSSERTLSTSESAARPGPTSKRSRSAVRSRSFAGVHSTSPVSTGYRGSRSSPMACTKCRIHPDSCPFHPFSSQF